MVALAIFARPPVPGRVKTRLIPELGAEGAARVYRYCLKHALAVAQDSQLEHRVYLSEAGQDDLFDQRNCVLQQGEDLGARMLRAFREILDDHADGAIVIGSDCLDLHHDHLHQAVRALIDHDLVLLPAADGGYALIGCRRAEPTLFAEIDWSSARVLTQTLARARSLDYRVCLLETVRDIDTLQGLKHYPELLGLIDSV